MRLLQEYLDIVVGNESEAEEMGKAFGFTGARMPRVCD